MNQPFTLLEHIFNITRMKALLWHSIGQLIGFGLADLATAISNHQVIVPAYVAVIAGLLIAQLTKAVNSYFDTKAALYGGAQ